MGREISPSRVSEQVGPYVGPVMLTLEVDTYRSQDHADDPPAPHISVHSPPDAHHLNSIVCTKEGHIPYLSNGRIWTLELIFDGASRQLTGWLKSKAEAKSGGKADDVSLWQATVPAGGDGGAWHVGVTGSCGGLWQKVSCLVDRITIPRLIHSARGS